MRRFALKHPETLLTIAGYDPSSGAGVTADLAVFAAHGFFGTSAISALTVQSTIGVQSVHPVDPAVFAATLTTLHSDLPPTGIKIGMLGSAMIVEAVAAYLSPLSVPIVLDTVLQSSSGRALLAPEALAVFQEKLLPLATWITPNTDELALLTGRTVASLEDVATAAAALQDRYGINIIATGGHLTPPSDYVLPLVGEGQWLRGERVETRATHGTGCAFSSAFLCGLVERKPALQAAIEAKEYVRQGMLRAIERGKGNGPINLLWPLNDHSSK